MMANSKTWRFGDKELMYVKEVLDSGFGSATSGNMNQRLEKAFAEKFGVRYAITHNSGTSTMHSCLGAAGIGPGDEVIVPALTVISTAFVVLHQNAVPVFADIDPRTFNIDPADVERKITPRTRAIIPVSLCGLPADTPALMKLAEKHNLHVIEDCAQCFLGTIDGRISGAIGHMGSFSFENSKHMSTGDGGIVITDSEELAERVRKFNSLGYKNLRAEEGRIRISRDVFQDPDYKRHEVFSWNYRLPEVAAAIGLAQIDRLDEFVAKRRAIARMYEEVVADCDWLLPQHVPDGYVSACWTYAVRYEGAETIGASWREFRAKHREFGGEPFYAAWSVLYLEPAIQNDVFYGKGCPTHCPLYEGEFHVEPGTCPVAEEVQPKLMLFQNNYGDIETAKANMQALRNTIDYFTHR
jgi:perosamine synthetase